MTFQDRRERQVKTRLLAVLILLGLAAAWLLRSPFPLSGDLRLDGILGVLFGLFICTQPAENFLDAFWFRRSRPPIAISSLSRVGWAGINLAAVLSGLFSVVAGLLRYSFPR